MNDRPARVSRSGPPPELEVIIGQAAFGAFRVIRWDATGRNPVVLLESTNVDNIPDKIPVASSAADADQQIVGWEANVAAYQGGPGQLYSVIVEISQNGEVVPDGTFSESGLLVGGAKLVFGAMRLIAV